MRFLLLQRHFSKNLLLYQQHGLNFKARLLPIKTALHGMRASSSYHTFYSIVINRIVSFIVFLLGAYFLLKTLSNGIHLPAGKTVNNETIIIVITPTHKRLERLADMTRFSNTLRHISNLHWIVVEDGNHTVPSVERVLFRSGLPYIYLATRTAPGMPPRGWTHRDLALTYIRENYDEKIPAVVYFGDDDNSYDVRLFTDYIRNVKRIGIWAVGLVGGAYVEAPHVENGKITKWDVTFAKSREFATDMAGFAINLKEIKRANASFNGPCAKAYKQGPENCFLKQFGYKKGDVEPFGHDREPREIMVWHTKTTKTAKTSGSTYGYAIEV